MFHGFLTRIVGQIYYALLTRQALGQDGWILANLFSFSLSLFFFFFFFCVFMDRNEVEETKRGQERGQ